MIVRIASASCDWGECTNAAVVDQNDVRRELRGMGWAILRDGDYCPTHAAAARRWSPPGPISGR